MSLTSVAVATITVAPLAGPEAPPVVRCDRCQMVQYRTFRNRCRRCYLSFPIEAPPPPPLPVLEDQHPDVAAGVRCWRELRGLTQKQLAVAAQLPRTYISRIENGRIQPGLPTLKRVAAALRVGLSTLLEVLRNSNGNGCPGNGNGNGHSSHPTHAGNGNGNGNGGAYITRETDDFLRQMVRYSSQLTPAQRGAVLAKVRELATVDY